MKQKKHQPKGFEILHEDLDVIVGCKTAGILTVSALWEKENTIHNILNSYIRKGSAHSKKSTYVVHRLDQATSGVLIFAKSESVQDFLKDNWKSTKKTYYAIVHGKFDIKQGVITSYLSEDEDYMVHSSSDSKSGKLAQTEYQVVKETPQFSLVKINLLTGKKNQIRVHMADEGHPIVGDEKYGKTNSQKPGGASQSNSQSNSQINSQINFQSKSHNKSHGKSLGNLPKGGGKAPLPKFKNLMLHSFSLEFTHPFNKRRIRIQADVPGYFKSLVDFDYCSASET